MVYWCILMVGICFLLWWWWSQFFHHWTLLILLMVVGWRFIVAFLWCYSRHRTGNNGIYNAYDVSPDDVRWPTEAGVLSGIQTWLENPTVCSMIFPANLPCYRGFSSHVWWLEATSIWRPTGVTSSFFFFVCVSSPIKNGTHPASDFVFTRVFHISQLGTRDLTR